MLSDSIDYECEAEFYHLSSSDLFFFYTKEIVLGDHLHNQMQIHSHQSCNLALIWTIRSVQFKTLYKIIAQTMLQTWFIWLKTKINMYTEDYIKMTNALKAITQYHGQKKLNTFNIIMILPSR